MAPLFFCRRTSNEKESPLHMAISCLIINRLFSVTENHVQDIYIFLDDHPHQFGKEVRFGDLLCSSYQRMSSFSDYGN
jgi:hypothetical protein